MNVNDLVAAMGETATALSFGDMSAEDVAKILAKDYTDENGKVNYEKFINDYNAKESEGVFAI
jgi:Ca2+-binding EF-hand superfamily protein